ncbi:MULTISPECIES: terminase large subunit [Rhizobium/Agrobacterium group]|uniref:Phage terminase-like protein large subunit n=1 Tax=Allorhizobium ampelinum (strain ATCC BAA-846 / DSM 112012 / S4) TaxID=311402 RepID=B9K2S0_ALLAM|nr:MULTISPECIES: terminase TerL endonuclease subunit [Rhizobium/Agrobacterium group]ACM39168.1 phage terminase-like protein large subunit [Allorhizobium ampelinum S4]MUO27200.1 terminase large subunit [Agrobacterium vitis]
MAALFPLAMPYPEWLADVADDPAYEWAISGWNRAAAVAGAWFDHRKADTVVARWPDIFRLTNDRFKGIPFRLVKWQEITVRLLVGWKKPIEVIDPRTHKPAIEHVRVFRRLDLWIPRKNGKSEFLAALGVLFFCLEKLAGAEGYVFARNEDQGRVPFEKMKDIIREANGIMEDAQGNARIAIFDKSIYVMETNSSCQLLTGSPDGKHGRSATVTVGDEIHEWKSTELADTLRQSSGARLQPIELYASTAGRKQSLTGYEWYEESVAIMRGEKEDPTTLVIHFAIGEDDDWTDEEVWRKANPSLGLTPTLDFLRTEYKKAKGSPPKEARFRCYHLNQWVDEISGWLSRSVWAECTKDAQSWRDLWEKHRGRSGYLSCDVSATQDLTSMVVTLPPDDDFDEWVLIPLFWIPEGTLDERAAKDRRVNWKKWAADEVVLTTPGDAVDQNFVLNAIILAIAHFQILKIGVDPWNAQKLQGDLQREGVDPELFQEMRMGHQTLSGPTKEFERLVLARKIEHGGHPILTWMAGHCAVRFDENLNYIPAKKRSADKIDGIVAAVMGVGLGMNTEDNSSVYDERGIEVL